MTEKEKTIEEILKMPLSYAKMYDLMDEGLWNIQKLEFTELHTLKQYLSDIKTFERNKKVLNGKA